MTGRWHMLSIWRSAHKGHRHPPFNYWVQGHDAMTLLAGPRQDHEQVSTVVAERMNPYLPSHQHCFYSLPVALWIFFAQASQLRVNERSCRASEWLALAVSVVFVHNACQKANASVLFSKDWVMVHRSCQPAFLKHLQWKSLTVIEPCVSI